MRRSQKFCISLCMESCDMKHITALLHQYLDAYPGLYDLVYRHSRQVADAALALAAPLPSGSVDRVFIEEAALLHDIGVFQTNAPKIRCTGSYPYICHGYLGRALLEKEGLPKHALVCERHTGTGLTQDDIVRQGLPLPVRDMMPISLEEELICFSDLFFSKSQTSRPKTVQEVREGVKRYGDAGLMRFDRWCERFGASHLF